MPLSKSQQRTIDPTIIRQYDIRGTFGLNFFVEDAYALGLAFAGILIEEGFEAPRIAIGRDCRLSSPELETYFIDGLLAGGANVTRVGIGPSPMLYFATHTLDVHAGVMITASHNPGRDNGLKFVLKHRPFYGASIEALAARINQGSQHVPKSGTLVEYQVQDAYLARLKEETLGLASFKIAWDPANGAASHVLQELLRELPGTHILINDTMDGTFPSHAPDPTEIKNLQQLITCIHENQCDFGVAFDGDGDRIGVVDDKGQVIWGDQLVMLFAREVLNIHPGAIIMGDVKASQTLFEEITRLGGEPLLWRTGHSFIKAKMKETGALLAGEMSGHIFFADRYYGYDDALYAALRFIRMMSQLNKPLSELRKELPQTYNTPELRYEVDESHKFALMEEAKRLVNAMGLDYLDIDGLRVQLDGGWWLLRASNTQSYLIARCEGTSPEKLKGVQDALNQILKTIDII